MRTPLLLSAALIVLNACTTTTQDVSPSQSYRPAGSDELWTITGNLENEFTAGLVNEVTRMLHVNINGVEVIRGQLSARATGELTGRYLNHTVVSNCSSEQRTENWIDVSCMILIDNERAATLTF